MASGSNVQDLLRDAMKGLLLEAGASGSLHMTFSDEVIRKAISQPLPASFSLAGEHLKKFLKKAPWSYASHAMPCHPKERREVRPARTWTLQCVSCVTPAYAITHGLMRSACALPQIHEHQGSSHH